MNNLKLRIEAKLFGSGCDKADPWPHREGFAVHAVPFTPSLGCLRPHAGEKFHVVEIYHVGKLMKRGHLEEYKRALRGVRVNDLGDRLVVLGDAHN